MIRRNRVSRRAFLHTAVAATAVPSFVPASALGQGNRAAANDRIVMGSIGVGGQGTGNTRTFQQHGDVQMVAVCDVVKEKRDRVKRAIDERYGNRDCAAYNDFRDLLARDDIDAVCISTPDHWHAIPSILAVKSGKDVYCEKPLSLTIGEARAMVEAVRRYDRIFQTGNNRRRECIHAAYLAAEGYLGEIREVYVDVGGPSGPCKLSPEPVPPGVDWDMWLGPAPWRPFHPSLIDHNFRPYFDYAGGGMTDMGAHQFDKVQWILGTKHSGPVEIYPPDGKDHERLTFVYANGVRVYHGGSELKTVTFVGDKAKASGRTLQTDPPGLTSIKPTREFVEHHFPNIKSDFLKCIRTRALPTSDVEIGARAVTVCHLGNIAYWLSRPLKWDPDREQFINDDEAKRWLDRAKREPWRVY